MAKGKGRGRRGLQPTGLEDFAGGDADKETIEKLAEAAKKQNEKGGHNSEPKDEVINRNFDSIELALIEIDNASRIMQKARAGLKAARDTAKTDCGSNAWVDSIVASVKLKRQGEKGGNGELVTEHRQIGRILRLKQVPLGVQFRLFHFDDAPADGAPVAAMDAELQGQAAWRNNEPITNNPFQQGTQEHVDWDQGHRSAMAASLKGASGDSAATH